MIILTFIQTVESSSNWNLSIYLK